MGRISSLITAGFCAASLLWGASAEACTGITVRAKNGDVVFSRTMEWDDGFIPAEILILPRNHSYQPHMPEPMKGMSWQGKYGTAGVAVPKVNAYIDGMNEKGLVIGAFYHEGFAGFATYSPERSGRSISSLDVIPYLLSTCANLQEVREALEKVDVVHTGKTEFGIAAPMHLMVTGPDGKQAVVEWVDGKPKFFESKLGVITNSPTYDWHLINLGNYIGLQGEDVQTRELEGQKIFALDHGTELLGMPGDFTSPSRFVRAAILSSYARRTPDAKEALYQAFQIMDSFNAPVTRHAAQSGKMSHARSETSWTTAHDLMNRAFYYHTSNDRTVQKIDVAKIDFGKLSKPVSLKLDNGEMTVIDRTGEISAK